MMRLPLAALALALLAAPVQAQQRPAGEAKPADAKSAAPQPAQIDRNGVLILVRSTLLALDHANRSGNYTVLRDLGAPGFQAVNTAARLAEIFASLRAQNLDLSGVAVLEPQLTLLPQVDERGMMRMAGFFPSVPLQVNFEMLFAPVEGRWRLFGLSVGLGQSTPAAPAEPAPAPAAQAEPTGTKSTPAPRRPAARPPAQRPPAARKQADEPPP